MRSISHKNFPEGWADIDPFGSYRSLFNGDLYASENPELIFTRGQNNTDIANMVRHQLPTSAGGYNCHGVTESNVTPYETNTGEPFDRKKHLKGYVSEAEANNGTYPHLRKGVNLEYATRTWLLRISGIQRSILVFLQRHEYLNTDTGRSGITVVIVTAQRQPVMAAQWHRYDEIRQPPKDIQGTMAELFILKWNRPSVMRISC